MDQATLAAVTTAVQTNQTVVQSSPLFSILGTLITAIFGWIAYAFHTSTKYPKIQKNLDIAKGIVEAVVSQTEQLTMNKKQQGITVTSQQKKEYALEQAQSHLQAVGIKLPDSLISSLIESAVYVTNNMFKPKSTDNTPTEVKNTSVDNPLSENPLKQ